MPFQNAPTVTTQSAIAQPVPTNPAIKPPLVTNTLPNQNQASTSSVVTPTPTNPTPVNLAPKPNSPNSSKPIAMAPINEAVQRYQISDEMIQHIRETPGIAIQPMLATAQQPVKTQSKISSSPSEAFSIMELVTLPNIVIGVLLFAIGALLVVVGANVISLVA